MTQPLIARITAGGRIKRAAGPGAAQLDPTPSPFDEELLEKLVASPMSGETIAAACARKELLIAELFRRLGVVDARRLHRRLSAAYGDDPIKAAFDRLIVERRSRLLSVLADAPRRAVVAARSSR